MIFYFTNQNNFKHLSENKLELITICVEKKNGIGYKFIKVLAKKNF